ncbi:MAG TPA: cupredoxin domain-containing protein [Telluria sp.]
MNPSPQRRLFVLGAAAGALSLLAPAIAARKQERVVQVRAHRFTYDPDEIRLARGEPVTFELTSLDVPMGFNLPDFGVRSDVLPGVVSRLRITPDKAGRFPFHCDIFCGAGHETMAGMIIVS